jgi:DNA replication and repair protein RecF
MVIFFSPQPCLYDVVILCYHWGMQLAHLEVENFRNYTELIWEPSPDGNLILGANGAGKSNLLESIFLLATGRSFRNAADRDLVRMGENGYALMAQAGDGSQTREVRLLYGYGEKRRASDMVGILKAVSFSPEDIAMVAGEPLLRRRFLDLWLGQVSPMYLADLGRAREAVQAKAHALRLVAQGMWGESQLEVWDATLAQEGARVMVARREAVAKLALAAQEVYQRLGGMEELVVHYKPAGRIADLGVEEAAVVLEEEMRERRSGEIALRQPLVGPSRDDLTITLGGMELRRKGSRGQQRIAGLGLKLAVWELMQREGQSGVLLLDDPASELDPRWVQGLVEGLDASRQFVLTATTVPCGWQAGMGAEWEISDNSIKRTKD